MKCVTPPRFRLVSFVSSTVLICSLYDDDKDVISEPSQGKGNIVNTHDVSVELGLQPRMVFFEQFEQKLVFSLVRS